MHKNKYVMDEKQLYVAIKFGHLHIVNYFLSYDFIFNEKMCQVAVKNGCLHIVKHLAGSEYIYDKTKTYEEII